MPETTPTVITIISMLLAAVSAFFFEKVHATAICSRRREEELKTIAAVYSDRLRDAAERLADLQQRLHEVETDRDEYKHLTFTLSGILEKVPETIRTKRG
jgi:hypothetical protein